ncbi:type II secretion system protein [Candidatus Kuenenbacteria bacterium]|nr:type II secretion system protein [Candidatus Kuenenbacteria bacterium]
MEEQKKNKSGFSLIEAVVVLFLFGFIGVMTLESYTAFRTNNNIYLARFEIISTLRRAATKSMAVSEDSAWGVNLANDRLIIFKGSNFNLRDINFDEVHPLPSQITISPGGDIIFNKFTGQPSSPVSITLSSNNSHAEIQINQKGFIAY